jgi:hypothetical protein
MGQRPQRGFPLLEAARLGHRIALQVGLQVADDLNRVAGNVRGDLVRGPAVAGADHFRCCRLDGGKERFGLSATSDHRPCLPSGRTAKRSPAARVV